MDHEELLAQIKSEYELWYQYIRPWRERYRKRLLKWMPSDKADGKITINMIANAIDTKIAQSFTNWVKAMFISRAWWIWEEQASNLNAVADFDTTETSFQQIKYQIYQDSEFFGLWILEQFWWDSIESKNKYKCLSPLSYIPDPLPTQTGQFDWQNHRFFWFTVRSYIMSMVPRYKKDKMDKYFKYRYDKLPENRTPSKDSDIDDQLTRDAYARKWGLGIITCDTLRSKNRSENLYCHYTIWNGKKVIVKCDMMFGFVFEIIEIKPVLKEEKLDPMKVPRPITLMFSDPQRNQPCGASMCDKLEDKQNGKSILANLNIIKAKREALGGDFLVNSRLIKNKDEFKKKTSEPRYFFLDEETIGTQDIRNAMAELPQSQIKTDTFNMINFLDNEARVDSKIDQQAQGLVSDKTMTNGEVQTVQANANQFLGKESEIRNWFWSEFYKKWLRWYLEHFKEWNEKFMTLSDNFQWKGMSLKKDEFLFGQSPYIKVASVDYINAQNEKHKSYLNYLYPQIVADPEMPVVCKNIFKRLVHRVNGLQDNVISSFMKYDPNELQAIEYVNMLNVWYKPTSLFDNPNADLFTYWLYIQKADDSKEKDEVLRVLRKALIDMGINGKALAQWDMQMSNSAANITMSQWLQWDQMIAPNQI